MKVALAVTSLSPFSKGAGGSFRSARTLAEALVRRLGAENVAIINFGDISAPALLGCQCQVVNVKYENRSFLSYIRDIIRAIDSLNVDVLHSFDNKAYFFCRVYSLLRGVRLVLTRPGGPNPRAYFPSAQSIVLFSEENRDFLREKRKHRLANVYFMPQRLSDVMINVEAVAKLKQRLAKDAKVILRIGRICDRYEDAGRQALRLGRFLRANGHACHVVILGSVDDVEVAQRLSSECSEHDLIVSDAEYTTNASQVLPVADLVVGTGRGVLEAGYLGLPVLCPTKDGDLPICITEENFDRLSRNNFSPRSELTDVLASENERLILDIVNGGRQKDEIGEFIRRRVIERYSVDGVVDEYISIYSYSEPEGRRIRQLSDVVLNMAQCFQFYIRSDIHKMIIRHKSRH